MEIKWPNVVTFALVIVAFITTLRMHEEMGGFLGSMRYLGSSPNLADRVYGLMAFGLVVIILVAVLRMLIENSNRDPP